VVVAIVAIVRYCIARKADGDDGGTPAVTPATENHSPVANVLPHAAPDPDLGYSSDDEPPPSSVKTVAQDSDIDEAAEEDHEPTGVPKSDSAHGYTTDTRGVALGASYQYNGSGSLDSDSFYIQIIENSEGRNVEIGSHSDIASD